MCVNVLEIVDVKTSVGGNDGRLQDLLEHCLVAGSALDGMDVRIQVDSLVDVAVTQSGLS